MSQLYKLSEPLKELKETPFKKERELQHMFETNLHQITGLTLVKSGYSIEDKRIDTLAFNPKSKALIIIQYKLEWNSSDVVVQGVTLLRLMDRNKADFILEYNERNPKNQLCRNSVNWSKSGIVFVSSSFMENQIEATNFKDLPIELYEVKRYGDLLQVTHIQKSRTAESFKPIVQNNPKYKSVADQIKVYTEYDLLSDKSEETVALYEKYRTAVLNLANDIEVKPQKLYVAFKINKHNICDIEIQSRGLKMTVNVKKGELDDPKGIARDISGVGHWGNGDYEIKISNDKNLEYIMSLVKQAVTG